MQEDTLSTTDERVGVSGEVLPVRAPARQLAHSVLADLSLPVQSQSAMLVCIWSGLMRRCPACLPMFCLTWPCIESLLTLQSP